LVTCIVVLRGTWGPCNFVLFPQLNSLLEFVTGVYGIVFEVLFESLTSEYSV